MAEHSRDNEMPTFEQLTSMHEGWVYNLAYWLLGDREQASTLAQNAFARVYEHSRKSGHRKPISWWLCCSSVKAYNEGQWKHTHPSSSDERLDGPHKVVMDALSRLSPDMRLIVVLKDMLSLSCEQIAEITGVAPTEIYDNPDLRQKYPEYSHKVMHIFVAELSDSNAKSVSELDLHQDGSQWIKIDKVPFINLQPELIKTKLREILATDSPVYLGAARIK